MGMLVNGQWRDEDPATEVGKAGNFQRRDVCVFANRIRRFDGSSGFAAEAGRYHLYVAYTCPWAHRTQIYLALKKLTGIISVAIAVPGLREQGWTFEDNAAFPDCTPDRVNGFNYLLQAYAASNPHYTGKVTVPTLWDKKTKRIVNNESSEIIRMLNAEFGALGADPTDFYPKHLRAEIDSVNAQVYANINNGVYRCGFAHSQARWRRKPMMRRCSRTLESEIEGAGRPYCQRYLWSAIRLHRGRLAAVSDADAFRRRLFLLSVQVQSQTSSPTFRIC